MYDVSEKYPGRRYHDHFSSQSGVEVYTGFYSLGVM